MNREFIPVKAAYFFAFFAISSFDPYLPVFCRDQGLNAEQAGIITGTRTFVKFFSVIFLGSLADKSRKHRLILTVEIVCRTTLFFSMPWVAKLLNSRTKDVTKTGHKLDDLNGKTVTSLVLNTTMNKPNDTVSIITSSTNNSINTNNTANTSAQAFHDQDTEFLFGLLLTITIMGSFCDGGVLMLIDNSIMEIIKKYGNVDFGRQRLWGTIGFGISSLSTGTGVQLTGHDKPNYMIMFYIYLGSNIILLMICQHLYKGDIRAESDNEGLRPEILKGVICVLRQTESIMFFLTIILMGMAHGLLYSFIFWFITDLNGSEITMGLSILVSSLMELIMYPISKELIMFVRGNMPAIAIGVLSYGLRFLGFSYLTNAWYILIFQIFHMFGFGMFWVAAMCHTTDLAPQGMTATMLGILNGVHFGFAQGIATIAGGAIYRKYGGRLLYRSFAIISAAWSAFLFVYILAKQSRKIKYKRESSETIVQNENIELVGLTTDC